MRLAEDEAEVIVEALREKARALRAETEARVRKHGLDRHAVNPDLARAARIEDLALRLEVNPEVRR